MTGPYGRPLDDRDMSTFHPVGGLIAYRQAGSEGVVEVSACGQCGAIVRLDDEERHATWHRDAVDLVALTVTVAALRADLDDRCPP